LPRLRTAEVFGNPAIGSRAAAENLSCHYGTAGGVAGFLLTNFISGRNHMLVKYITAGLAASALLASVAFAQTPTTTGDRANMAPAPAAASDSSYQGNWRASKLVGLKVLQ
jgi:hypothetical protein